MSAVTLVLFGSSSVSPKKLLSIDTLERNDCARWPRIGMSRSSSSILGSDFAVSYHSDVSDSPDSRRSATHLERSFQIASERLKHQTDLVTLRHVCISALDEHLSWPHEIWHVIPRNLNSILAQDDTRNEGLRTLTQDSLANWPSLCAPHGIQAFNCFSYILFSVSSTTVQSKFRLLRNWDRSCWSSESNLCLNSSSSVRMNFSRRSGLVFVMSGGLEFLGEQAHLRQNASRRIQCPISSARLSSSTSIFLAVLLDNGKWDLICVDISSRNCAAGSERSCRE